jgi:predicted acetyltransferase
VVALTVRAIRPDELDEWVGVAHVAFHDNRPVEADVAFRRDAVHQDFERTLAALDGDCIVGTLESFPCELTLPGGASLTADAISAVSVLPTHQRRGALTRMITDDLRAAKERGEAVSILIPSEYPIYGRFGFGPATTRVEYAVDPAAARFTRAAAGQVEFAQPSRLRELAPPIFERFRRSRPGQIDRRPLRWDVILGLRQTPWQLRDSVLRCAIHTDASGEADGYLCYRTEDNRQNGMFGSRLDLAELIALTGDAYVGLWRFCCEMDLITEVRAAMRCPDEPLHWLLTDTRAAISERRRSDFLWVRALDTPRFLSHRQYACEERLVLDVSDPLKLCGGRFVLEAGAAGATCRATDAAADLSLGMTALGALSLGGRNLHVLADAGLIEEERPGALATAERLFHWPITPWCSTGF